MQADGRIAGDRVLAFRFASDVEPRDRGGLDYWPKSQGLALMDFPSLARLRLAFDGATLRISEGERLLVAAPLDDQGRRELEEAVTAYVAATTDARRLDVEGALPLRLVGDGRTSRFQDRPRGFVSLHGAASVRDVDAEVSAPVDDRRFRSNIVIEGTEPWEELGWEGSIRIGDVFFDVRQPIERCAAIMANPDTGERDARLLRLLTTTFGQPEATLGILLLPTHGEGVVNVGDEIVFGGPAA
ncbi:MOSC domain-containing protein [Microbacterium sp. P05]|uniref:MOSC domain-containing protein n=1 Tax=Microbacterium sp. P05 TaxID=3366948 RepID=UPI003745919B